MPGHLLLGVPPKQDANQPTIRIGDNHTPDPPRPHLGDKLCQQAVRPNGNGASRHDLLHGSRGSASQRGSTQPSKDDLVTINDDALVPAGTADALPHVADSLVQMAKRDIPPQNITGPGTASHLSLERKAIGKPGLASWFEAVDLVKAEGLEPPRGSGTHISLEVIAVDHDRPVPRQARGCRAAECLERQIHRAGNMLPDVLLCRENIHQEPSPLDERLEVFDAGDGLDHRDHAAQQESFETSRPNAWAASLRPSDIVRYGAKVSTRSCTVRWNFTASTPA
jgi:hypothetical protein